MERRSNKLVNRIDRIMDRYDFMIVVILFVFNLFHAFLFDRMAVNKGWIAMQLGSIGAVSVLFVLVVFHTIFRILIGHRQVRVQDILVFIMSYGVIILQFALFYGCLSRLSLFSGRHLFFNLDPNQIIDYIYYSGNVMTSLGFGDIVPIHPLTKVLCVFEASLGQIMMVLAIGAVIAQISGIHFLNQSREK